MTGQRARELDRTAPTYVVRVTDSGLGGKREPSPSIGPAVPVAPEPHRLLADTLHTAHTLELWLRQALVSAMAKDSWAGDQLDDLLLRLDFGRKVTMLESWLTEQGKPTQPLIAQMRALNDIRNVLAHAVPLQHQGGPGHMLMLGRIRRSAGPKVQRLNVAEVRATIKDAESAIAAISSLSVFRDPNAEE